MPRTHPAPSADGQVEGTQGWLDNLDPAHLHFRDASHVREIIAAVGAVAAAEEHLRSVVADARAAGDSWTVIGAALGTTKQAAHERFRAYVDR